MSDARRYAVWPEPRSRSRSLKGSRPSVPHGTNFYIYIYILTMFLSPVGESGEPGARGFTGEPGRAYNNSQNTTHCDGPVGERDTSAIPLTTINI